MKEMICIVCPKGCHMSITPQGDNFKVAGNACGRGEKYAVEEMTCPKRMIPTTVKIEGGLLNRLPVITDQPIEKKYIFDLMNALNDIKMIAPVKKGDIIIENIFDTKVNIVASRSMM